MTWQKAEQIYDGKGKRVFAIKGESQLLLQEFKNQLTAFNAQKVAELDGKGEFKILDKAKTERFSLCSSTWDYDGDTPKPVTPQPEETGDC